MKKFLIAILFLGTAICSQAQIDSKINTDEAAIRKIEALSVIAMNTQDTIFMHKFVSQDYVVMNPNHKIHGFRGLMELLAAWKKHNAEMKVAPPHTEHVIEKITINKDIAIVMGQDVPDSGLTTPDGKPMSKHVYTNIYRRYLDTWQIIARQNSNICQ